MLGLSSKIEGKNLRGIPTREKFAVVRNGDF
jgi:hypothetical protein